MTFNSARVRQQNFEGCTKGFGQYCKNEQINCQWVGWCTKTIDYSYTAVIGGFTT